VFSMHIIAAKIEHVFCGSDYVILGYIHYCHCCCPVLSASCPYIMDNSVKLTCTRVIFTVFNPTTRHKINANNYFPNVKNLIACGLKCSAVAYLYFTHLKKVSLLLIWLLV
jgi:hypothetical protein